MKNFWERRIPTVLALVLLIIGVGATTYLVQTQTNLFGHAAPSETPQNIRITNVTDSSFTVTYQTDASVIGTVSLGKDNPQTVLDERDQEAGVPKQYFLHSITAHDLKPSTEYSFTILSGPTTFLNNGNQFAVTTGPKIDTPPSTQIPLAGRLAGADGQKPDEAIIYVTATNGQTLSTLLKSSGLYILPLNAMRSKDLQTAYPITSETVLQLLAIDKSSISHVTTLAGASNPVPVITLSQDFDFTTSINPVASTGGVESKFPEFPIDKTLVATPKIISPQADQTFSDQQPLFQGTAQPNGTVKIEIHSDDAITTSVTANGAGSWVYRPDKPLSPGQHTISITTADQFGILHTVQQSFTVFAAGSQVNQTATPSATPTTRPPTPTPTNKPSGQTPTAAPTATPVPIITNGQIKGGLLPSSTLAPKMSPLPPTGSNDVVVAGVAGIATTALGIILFLLTRGAVL